MKNLKLYFVSALVLFMSACNDFVDDYGVSPNDPSEVTPALLLSGAQAAVFATYNGQLTRTGNMMTQHLSGTDFQMVEYDNYVIMEGDNNNEWIVIYNHIIEPCNNIIDVYGDENPYYRGMARVLKAMGAGVATDYWGDIPLSEAAKGLTEGNLEPMYDNQEDVIKAIQTMLDDAIADFGADPASNANTPGADDLIAGGDIDAWKRFAYMLKARYAIRLTKKDKTSAADAALQALVDAGLTGNSDDMLSRYGTNGNELNPWDAFEQDRGGYLRVGATLMDMMLAKNDPRISAYAAVDTGGAYRGAILGSGDQTASPIGTHLRATTGDLISYVECKFIQAEANFHKGELTGAANAYNEAINASIMKVTGAADTAYSNMYANENNATITLEKIMDQKYIAMFGQCEAWADWRRTNMPALTPNPNAQITEIPRRLPTVIEERLYNSNAPSNTDITAPVWWDE